MNTELVKQSTDLVARAAGLRVVDQESLTKANELYLAGKGMVKTIKDFFAPLKQAAHASWKVTCDNETNELGKILPTLSFLDREIINFRVEQDRIRREAEEKSRRQEAERLRLEAETLRKAEEAARRNQLEQDRIDREARARELQAKTRAVADKIQAEAERKRQELAAKAKEEQDAIIDTAAAQEAKLEPVVIVPEKVVTEKVALCHNWKFRVADPAAVPREYLIVNETLVGKLVRNSEGKIQIAGIEIYDEPYTRTK